MFNATPTIKIATLTVLVLFLVLPCKSQQYIVFERKQTLTWKPVVNQILLAQNEVLTKHGDTSLSIFNLYFTSDTVDIGRLNSDTLRKEGNRLTSLSSDVLFTMVPMITPGDQLKLKKISKNEVAALNVLSHEQVLKNIIPKLATVSEAALYEMPSLKSKDFRLIIKMRDAYFLVEQQVLSVAQVVSHVDWYFPNQFKDAVIPYSLTYQKAYRFKDIENFRKDFRDIKLIRQQIQNRIYFSGVDTANVFHLPIYNYWESLNDDAMSIMFSSQKLEQFQPGLGSFGFIAKIGIVSCTLDYYLKKEILFDQPQNFKVISVNGLDPKNVTKLIISKQVFRWVH
ncbi:hypothetical protein [Pedobacter sp. GR22-6]|uniref:hypothetical protein n=1 Tax=Pedobacter sp. GR22-6 TaxID=3127957 RepID=UPI00307D910B